MQYIIIHANIYDSSVMHYIHDISTYMHGMNEPNYNKTTQQINKITQ